MGAMKKTINSLDVGSRLKVLREERGISMRSLARSSALSANALSMIERGLTSPSVSTLAKIAAALEVPLTAFFRTVPERKSVVLSKFNEHSPISFEGVMFEGLGSEKFDGKMEAFKFTVMAGQGSGSQGMIHTGKEIVYCLNGQFEYDVEGTHYLLEGGDCLFISGKLRHSWKNTGDSEAQILVVVSSFDEGESPMEFHLASFTPDELD